MKPSVVRVLERTRARKAAGLIPDYRAGGVLLPRKVGGGCRYRGEPTGETVSCKSCRGNVSLKVFSCGIFGECTLTKPVENKGCCAGCPRYAPPEEIARAEG